MGKAITYSYGNCRKNSPCKNCEDRKLGCHDRCERYLEFKKDGQSVRDKVHSNRDKEADCISFTIRNSRKREY